MIVALLVIAVAAAAPLVGPGAGLYSELPQASNRGGGGTLDQAAVVTTPGCLAGHSLPDLPTTTKHRDGCKQPSDATTDVIGFTSVRKRNTDPSGFLEFIASLRSRCSSETPLPARDKHLSPIRTPVLTGTDVGASFRILQNVQLYSEKELYLYKVTQSSSQSPLEHSPSASNGEAPSYSASVTEEETGELPKAVPTSSPPTSSTRHSITGSVLADASILSHITKLERVALNASTVHATNENLTLAHNEYQLRDTAEQVVFTDTKSASLSPQNAGGSVVEVEISKLGMTAAQKETEEMIIKDTTLIIVFSCLAVLVIVVCKIVRYVMEYRLSKHEQRLQNAGARSPC